MLNFDFMIRRPQVYEVGEKVLLDDPDKYLYPEGTIIYRRFTKDYKKVVVMIDVTLKDGSTDFINGWFELTVPERVLNKLLGIIPSSSESD
jgi:hypothetical protein